MRTGEGWLGGGGGGGEGEGEGGEDGGRVREAAHHFQSAFHVPELLLALVLDKRACLLIAVDRDYTCTGKQGGPQPGYRV